MPRWTGTPGIPIQSNTRSVFSVQLSTLVLPLTTLAPTSSMSGDSAAVMRATASSVPVSTSRMIFVAMRQVCRVGVPRAGRSSRRDRRQGRPTRSWRGRNRSTKRSDAWPSHASMFAAMNRS